MKPLGIAVVGLGWWGRVIVPLAKTSAKLRAVAAADPVRLRKVPG
jgi:predicted dehydrogenase